MYLAIDRKSQVSISRQLYEHIQISILKGQLKAHEQLPSTRQMAQINEVSRIVVVEAYEQLLAEGYLYTMTGSGTFVAVVEPSGIQTEEALNSEKTDGNLKGLRHESSDFKVDFRTGAPDLSLFPIAKWGMMYRQVCQDIEAYELDYYISSGSAILKRELLDYLYRTRGIHADDSQVMITTGAAQAFTLLSRLLLGHNDTVIVEDPINQDIFSMLTSTGATIHSQEVDEHGIGTEFIDTVEQAKVIFTTPSHQFPMGGILSINRRMALINYAAKSHGYIIEDDYDSAFRFKGSPVSALHSLAPQQVIYTGTFSKTLFPALRIGYVILPNVLVHDFKRLKYLEDLHTPILEQLTLARFIREGFLERHIHNCKKVYQRKNQYLRQRLEEDFGDEVRIIGDSAGIHLVAAFRNDQFDEKDFDGMMAIGLHISAIAPHTKFPENHLNELMFGYGHLSLDEISIGVQLLKAYIDQRSE